MNNFSKEMNLDAELKHSQLSMENELKKKLPSYIISQIADIRVAAFWVVSQKTYDQIKKYSDSIKKYCEDTRKEYLKIYKNNLVFFSKTCLEAIDCGLDDAMLLKYEKMNNELKLYFSLDTYTKEDGYDVVFSFKNGVFIEKIGDLKQEYVKTKEIYYNEGKIEFHLLCEKSQCIVQADDLYHQYSDDYIWREGL